MGSLLECKIEGFICRLCSQIDRNVIHLYTEEGMQKKLEQKINVYLKINLSRFDPLPKVICLSCDAKLEQHHRFIQRVIQNQKKIQGNRPIIPLLEQHLRVRVREDESNSNTYNIEALSSDSSISSSSSSSSSNSNSSSEDSSSDDEHSPNNSSSNPQSNLVAGEVNANHRSLTAAPATTTTTSSGSASIGGGGNSGHSVLMSIDRTLNNSHHHHADEGEEEEDFEPRLAGFNSSLEPVNLESGRRNVSAANLNYSNDARDVDDEI